MLDTHKLILQVNKLGVRRSERWLFRNLDLKLSSGEIYQVVGQNGAGKTSLLRCLCGLLPEQEGDIAWQQDDEMPIIPLFYGHLPAVKPELTVLENLLYHPINGNFYNGDVIEAALHEVGLGAYFDSEARHLSAGQARRVALARLLIADSKCWILDEPFTALDVKGCTWLEGIISSYVKRGGSVLLTSHQPVSLDVELKVLEIVEDMNSHV